MVSTYFRNEREFDSFQVVALNKKHEAMNTAYMNSEYGEAINYARTLIESTCKYVYHELTDEELEIEEGHYISATGTYFANLNVIIKSCLKKLSTIIEYPEEIAEMSKEITELVNITGSVRNSSSLSHGNRHGNLEPQRTETRFFISIAEDICMLLLDLLHERTTIEKPNAIGSIINPEGLTKYDDAYQKSNTFLTVRYLTVGQVVQQVDLTFKNGINMRTDGEFVNGHIKDYLPDDAGKLKQLTSNSYQYYSDRQDKHYEVLYEETTDSLLVYITGINTD